MNPDVLRKQGQAFIRAFGLLDQSRTPCGQDIPISQAHAIQILGQNEGVSQKFLADELHLDKSTTSRLVSQLVEREWVTRRPNSLDRRETHLELTDQGKEILGQVSQSALARYSLLWEQISPDKRTQVIESLNLLTQALKEM
jgi:DNA-binding MarR family transcriptional regulator